MPEQKRREKELLHMQVRLFDDACKRWACDIRACADLFDKYNVDQYIDDLYDLFHTQGDEAILDDIETYLRAQGAEL